MQDNITVLANIIGRVYRGYDEFPDIDTDEEIYLSDRQRCFKRMAEEYAEVLQRGTVVNQDEERPKALLRGMLKHIDDKYTNELIIKMHWDAIDHDFETYAKDEWIAMDSTIKTMLV